MKRPVISAGNGTCRMKDASYELATALIYTWIAGGRLKEAQKIVDRWMEKEEGYTEENAEIFGAASLLRTVSGNISVERN